MGESQKRSEGSRADNGSPKRRRHLDKTIYGLGIFLIVGLGIGLYCWNLMINMPGDNYGGRILPLTTSLQHREPNVKKHVTTLATDIGERNLAKYPQLIQAGQYIESEFKKYGYTPKRQTYKVGDKEVFNIEVEVLGTGKADEIIIIGAHYDTAEGTPGANDNGTGIALLLSLSEIFHSKFPKKTLRFVAFTNEEPPYFQDPQSMGSY
ncbi:MAG: M28 family peptidase, partial [Pirellulaceae bacterium]|nr:M28 family peptidase [Pirellulaceae bacterium]